MLEDFLKSAQTHVSERFSSPLMGSFVIAWSLWNYKFLVVLLSSASVSQTFKLIDTLVFPETQTLLVRGLLLPALSAAAYIFLYPYPAKVVYEFTRKRQKEINDIRRRIEDETPLTIEESRKIRSEVIRIENEHSQELDRKNRDIERLKAEVASLRSNAPETPTSPPAMANEGVLELTQLALLRLIERLKGKGPEKMLIQQSSEPQVKVEFDLGELVNHGLLTKKYSSPVRDYIYEFTHEGRSRLLQHRNEEA